MLNDTISSIRFLSELNEDAKSDLQRATYFMLEAAYPTEWGYQTTIMEDAEHSGVFALYIGLPNQPAHDRAVRFTSFEDGLAAFEMLKQTHPNATYWLDAMHFRVEIEGDDVWSGAVHARASVTKGDPCCPWNVLSGALRQSAVQGRRVVLITDEMPTLIKNIAHRL